MHPCCRGSSVVSGRNGRWIRKVLQYITDAGTFDTEDNKEGKGIKKLVKEKWICKRENRIKRCLEKEEIGRIRHKKKTLLIG